MSEQADAELSIKQLINRRVRECLDEMPDKPPRDRNALAATVESLLKARPLASDDGFDLLQALLGTLEKNQLGLRAIADKDHE